MGRIFGLYSSFTSYTPTASSQAAGGLYNDDNLLLYSRPQKAWRSAVTTGENIVLDFGSAKTIVGFLIQWTNFTSCSLQGNATDSWGAPSLNDSVTIAKDTRVGRYSAYVVPSTTFNYRFARVLIPSQTPTDGAAYHSIGNIIALSSVTELTENPDYPYSVDINEAVSVTQYKAGGEDVSQLGPIDWVTLAFPFDVSSYPSEVLTVKGNGCVNPLVYYENDSGGTQYVYLVRRKPTVRMRIKRAGVTSFEAITLNEVL